jgi:hypothetical protein
VGEHGRPTNESVTSIPEPASSANPPVDQPPFTESLAEEPLGDEMGAELFGEEVEAMVPAEPPTTHPEAEGLAAAEPTLAVADDRETVATDVDDSAADADPEERSFDDIFGEVIEDRDAGSTAEAVAEPTPRPSSTVPALPWEVDAEVAPEQQRGGDAEVAPRPSEATSPLTWDAPRLDNEVPPGIATPGTVDDSDNWRAAEATPSQQVDSRQLAWQLSSRLSYLLLAPDVDAAAATRELAPAAQVLEVQLPKLGTTAGMGETDRLRNLLAVGRELGSTLGDRHGADHAALVEVAFKSNLLMAAAATRPQLKHSISSSVGAAAVRAGIPEMVWQPWQDRVAESSSPDDIAAAVVDLHSRLGTYLEQLAATDDASRPPVLR